MLRRIYAVEGAVIPAGHANDVPVTMKRIISCHLGIKTVSTVLVEKTIRPPYRSRGIDISVPISGTGKVTREISGPVGRVRHGYCLSTRSVTPE